jgi:hypothetical protein
MRSKLTIILLFSLLFVNSIFARQETLTATYIGKQEGAISEGSFDENLLDYTKAVVYFDNNVNSKYTIDEWLPYYDNVSIIRYNQNNQNEPLYPEVAQGYHVKWKFIPEGKSDELTAKLEIKDNALINPDSIIFKSKNGVVFKRSAYDAKTNTFTVTLTAGQADSRQEVFALHPSNKQGEYWNLGKLYIDSRAPKTSKMVVVDLGGSYDKSAIEMDLNKVYNPVGIYWTVEEHKGLSYDGSILENLFDKSSGLLSAYNSEMKALNAALIQNLGDKYDASICYVLVMKSSKAGNDRDVAGFMPRGNQFCYVYTDKLKPLSIGIAHELGHGRFKLRHSFDNDYGKAAEATKNTSNNLMDYHSGTHIAKWQWDQIYNPAILNAVFDRDEEAMVQGTYTIEFTQTANFVQLDTILHRNFIKKYASAYRNYQINGNKEDEKLINQVLNIKINEKTYRTNSVATIFGRDHSKAYIGRFQDLFEIGNLLELIIAHSSYVFYDLYMGHSLEYCVLNESVGRNKILDYKWELYRILKDHGLNENDLIAIDDVVYNANEIGNYIWALVLTYHGILPNPSWIAETGTKGRNDEPWEQRAITNGKDKANNLQIDKNLILQYRLEYFHLLYNDTDKSWREIDPLKDLRQ